ncbi:hypothetical protein BC941DRAFT_465398 [Chlamydoabsidia padenii]|nr:hypothetical protein BC941DRAFT_465398 [Chlamydoabsidia padenii]
MKTSLVVIITHLILLQCYTRPIFASTPNDSSTTPCQETINQELCLPHYAHHAVQTPPHQHSSAFKAVHVIAAVAGMMGILIIGIVSFFMIRRRRRKQQQQEPDDFVIKETTLTNDKPNQQFIQFASDFCSSEDSIAPPSMQQRVLQLELLKQQQQQHTSMNSSPSSPPPYYP